MDDREVRLIIDIGIVLLITTAIYYITILKDKIYRLRIENERLNEYNERIDSDKRMIQDILIKRECECSRLRTELRDCVSEVDRLNNQCLSEIDRAKKRYKDND